MTTAFKVINRTEFDGTLRSVYNRVLYYPMRWSFPLPIDSWNKKEIDITTKPLSSFITVHHAIHWAHYVGLHLNQVNLNDTAEIWEVKLFLPCSVPRFYQEYAGMICSVGVMPVKRLRIIEKRNIEL